MGQKYTLYIRVIAWLLIASFGVEQVVQAAPLNGSQGQVTFGTQEVSRSMLPFDIPFEYVELKEVHQGSNGRTLIYIQDAHANLSGQESLAKSLEHLMQRHAIQTVLVEGSAQDVSLDRLRILGEPEAWKKVARRFLMDGVISGEEYLNLTSDLPMQLIGIEDRELYDAGLMAYSDLVRERTRVSSQLKQIKHTLTRLKNRIYPRDLIRYEDLKKTSLHFLEPLDALFKIARLVDLELKGYPELLKLKSLREKEKNLDFKKINAEQTTLIANLMTDSTEQQLKQALAEFKTARNSPMKQYLVFNSILKMAQVSGAEFETYAALKQYRRYLEAFVHLHFDELFQEAERLEAEIYERLLVDRDAQMLWGIDRFVKLLDSAFKVQMNGTEYKRFQANRREFPTMAWLAFLNQKSLELKYFSDILPQAKQIDQALDSISAFYDLVEARDYAFIKNIEQILSSSETTEAFLITGGYHTQNLTQLLRRNDYSYLVLAPRVTSETDHDKYEQILLQPLQYAQKHPDSSVAEHYRDIAKRDMQRLSAQKKLGLAAPNRAVEALLKPYLQGRTHVSPGSRALISKIAIELSAPSADTQPLTVPGTDKVGARTGQITLDGQVWLPDGQHDEHMLIRDLLARVQKRPRQVKITVNNGREDKSFRTGLDLGFNTSRHGVEIETIQTADVRPVDASTFSSQTSSKDILAAIAYERQKHIMMPVPEQLFKIAVQRADTIGPAWSLYLEASPTYTLVGFRGFIYQLFLNSPHFTPHRERTRVVDLSATPGRSGMSIPDDNVLIDHFDPPLVEAGRVLRENGITTWSNSANSGDYDLESDLGTALILIQSEDLSPRNLENIKQYAPNRLKPLQPHVGVSEHTGGSTLIEVRVPFTWDTTIAELSEKAIAFVSHVFEPQGSRKFSKDEVRAYFRRGVSNRVTYYGAWNFPLSALIGAGISQVYKHIYRDFNELLIQSELADRAPSDQLDESDLERLINQFWKNQGFKLGFQHTFLQRTTRQFSRILAVLVFQDLEASAQALRQNQLKTPSVAPEESKDVKRSAGSRVGQLTALWEKRKQGYDGLDYIQLNQIATAMVDDLRGLHGDDLDDIGLTRNMNFFLDLDLPINVAKVEAVIYKFVYLLRSVGDEERENFILVFRIAQTMLSDFGHERELISKRNQDYNQSRIYGKAVMDLYPTDTRSINAYAITLTHLGRFEEAEEVFKSISNDDDIRRRNNVGLAKLHRQKAKALLELYQLALKQHALSEAYRLLHLVMDELKEARSLLHRVTLPFRQGQRGDSTQVAAAFVELADTKRIESDIYHAVLNSALSSGVTDYTTKAFLSACDALKHASDAIAAAEGEVSGRAQQHAIQTYRRMSRIVLRALNTLRNRKSVSLEQLPELKKRISTLERIVTLNQAHTLDIRANATTLEPIIASQIDRFDALEVMQQQVIAAIQSAAQSDPKKTGSVEDFRDRVQEIVHDQYSPSRYAEVDAVIAYTLGELHLDYTDLMVLQWWFLMEVRNARDLANQLVGEIPEITPQDITNRLADGRFESLGVTLPTVVSHISPEEPLDSGYIKNTSAYSQQAIRAYAKNDLHAWRTALDLYQRLQAWPILLPSRSQRLAEIATNGIGPNVTSFSERARLLSDKGRTGQTTAQEKTQLRDSLQFLREGDQSDKRGGYLPELYEFIAMGSKEAERVENHIRDEAKIVEGYATHLADFRDRYGLAWVTRVIDRLNRIAQDIGALAHKGNEKYLSYRTFTNLSAEARRLYDEVLQVESHAEVLKDLSVALNRLSDDVSALEQVAPPLVAYEARNAWLLAEQHYSDTVLTKAFHERVQILEAEVRATTRFVAHDLDEAKELKHDLEVARTQVETCQTTCATTLALEVQNRFQTVHARWEATHSLTRDNQAHIDDLRVELTDMAAHVARLVSLTWQASNLMLQAQMTIDLSHRHRGIPIEDQSPETYETEMDQLIADLSDHFSHLTKNPLTFDNADDYEQRIAQTNMSAVETQVNALGKIWGRAYVAKQDLIRTEVVKLGDILVALSKWLKSQVYDDYPRRERARISNPVDQAIGEYWAVVNELFTPTSRYYNEAQLQSAQSKLGVVTNRLRGALITLIQDHAVLQTLGNVADVRTELKPQIKRTFSVGVALEADGLGYPNKYTLVVSDDKKRTIQSWSAKANALFKPQELELPLSSHWLDFNGQGAIAMEELTLSLSHVVYTYLAIAYDNQSAPILDYHTVSEFTYPYLYEFLSWRNEQNPQLTVRRGDVPFLGVALYPPDDLNARHATYMNIVDHYIERPSVEPDAADPRAYHEVMQNLSASFRRRTPAGARINAPPFEDYENFELLKAMIDPSFVMTATTKSQPAQRVFIKIPSVEGNNPASQALAEREATFYETVDQSDDPLVQTMHTHLAPYLGQGRLNQADIEYLGAMFAENGSEWRFSHPGWINDQYLITGQASGRSLSSYIREFHGSYLKPTETTQIKQRELEILRMLQRVAETLDDFHQAGVILRDLHPDEIFLDQDHVTIIDLGLSTWEGNPNPSLHFSNLVDVGLEGMGNSYIHRYSGTYPNAPMRDIGVLINIAGAFVESLGFNLAGVTEVNRALREFKSSPTITMREYIEFDSENEMSAKDLARFFQALESKVGARSVMPNRDFLERMVLKDFQEVNDLGVYVNDFSEFDELSRIFNDDERAYPIGEAIEMFEDLITIVEGNQTNIHILALERLSSSIEEFEQINQISGDTEDELRLLRALGNLSLILDRLTLDDNQRMDAAMQGLSNAIKRTEIPDSVRDALKRGSSERDDEPYLFPPQEIVLISQVDPNLRMVISQAEESQGFTQGAELLNTLAPPWQVASTFDSVTSRTYSKAVERDLLQLAGTQTIQSVLGGGLSREDITGLVSEIHNNDLRSKHKALTFLANYSHVGVTDTDQVIKRLMAVYADRGDGSSRVLTGFSIAALRALMRNAHRVNIVNPHFFGDAVSAQDFGAAFINYHDRWHSEKVELAILKHLGIEAIDQVEGSYYFRMVAMDISAALDAERSGDAEEFKVGPLTVIHVAKLMEQYAPHLENNYEAANQLIKEIAKDSVGARQTPPTPADQVSKSKQFLPLVAPGADIGSRFTEEVEFLRDVMRRRRGMAERMLSLRQGDPKYVLDGFRADLDRHVLTDESGEISLAELNQHLFDKGQAQGIFASSDARDVHAGLFPLNWYLHSLKQNDIPSPDEAEMTRVARIALDNYLLHRLISLSLRIWDDNQPNENLDALQELLDELQGPEGSGQQFVEHATDLLMMAYSKFNKDVSVYYALAERVTTTLNDKHRRLFIRGYVEHLASHLRGIYHTLGEGILHVENWSHFRPLRVNNHIDYFLMYYFLPFLIRDYQALTGADQLDERIEIAETILMGVSSDPQLFLNAVTWDIFQMLSAQTESTVLANNPNEPEVMRRLKPQLWAKRYFDVLAPVRTRLVADIKHITPETSQLSQENFPDLGRYHLFAKAALDVGVGLSMRTPGIESVSYNKTFRIPKGDIQEKDRALWTWQVRMANAHEQFETVVTQRGAGHELQIHPDLAKNLTWYIYGSNPSWRRRIYSVLEAGLLSGVTGARSRNLKFNDQSELIKKLIGTSVTEYSIDDVFQLVSATPDEGFVSIRKKISTRPRLNIYTLTLKSGEDTDVQLALALNLKGTINFTITKEGEPGDLRLLKSESGVLFDQLGKALERRWFADGEKTGSRTSPTPADKVSKSKQSLPLVAPGADMGPSADEKIGAGSRDIRQEADAAYTYTPDQMRVLLADPDGDEYTDWKVKVLGRLERDLDSVSDILANRILAEAKRTESNSINQIGVKKLKEVLSEMMSHLIENGVDSYLQMEGYGDDLFSGVFQQDFDLIFLVSSRENDVVLRIIHNGVPLRDAETSDEKKLKRGDGKYRLGGENRGMNFSRRAFFEQFNRGMELPQLHDRRDEIGDEDGTVIEIAIPIGVLVKTSRQRPFGSRTNTSPTPANQIVNGARASREAVLKFNMYLNPANMITITAAWNLQYIQDKLRVTYQVKDRTGALTPRETMNTIGLLANGPLLTKGATMIIHVHSDEIDSSIVQEIADYLRDITSTYEEISEEDKRLTPAAHDGLIALMTDFVERWREWGFPSGSRDRNLLKEPLPEWVGDLSVIDDTLVEETLRPLVGNRYVAGLQQVPMAFTVGGSRIALLMQMVPSGGVMLTGKSGQTHRIEFKQSDSKRLVRGENRAKEVVLAQSEAIELLSLSYKSLSGHANVVQPLDDYVVDGDPSALRNAVQAFKRMILSAPDGLMVQTHFTLNGVSIRESAPDLWNILQEFHFELEEFKSEDAPVIHDLLTTELNDAEVSLLLSGGQQGFVAREPVSSSMNYPHGLGIFMIKVHLSAIPDMNEISDTHPLVRAWRMFSNTNITTADVRAFRENPAKALKVAHQFSFKPVPIGARVLGRAIMGLLEIFRSA